MAKRRKKKKSTKRTTPKRNKQLLHYDDRPPEEALQHCHGIERVVNPVDSRARRVWRKKDGLDVMLRQGTISNEEYLAAREFQDDFDLGRMHGYVTQNLDKPAGKQRSYYSGNLPAAMIDARQRVMDTLHKLGGDTAPMGQAVWHYLGLRKSLKDILADKDLKGSKDYWMTSLKNALTVMANPDLKIHTKRKKTVDGVQDVMRDI